MNIIKITVASAMLSIFSLPTYAYADSDKKAEDMGNGHHDMGHHRDHHNLDGRIEKWVKETCGDDKGCAEKKHSYYKKRMAKYKQRVKEKCGNDKTCHEEVRAQYMARRAKREKRINKHCGDDKVCRNNLREEYRKIMDTTREKCGVDKTCWEKVYKEKKPKE